jgi:hypothetical protein
MNVRFGPTSALLVRHIGRLRHCQLCHTGGKVSAMLAAGSIIGTGLDCREGEATAKPSTRT